MRRPSPTCCSTVSEPRTTPSFPDMHEACARVVGGVLAACRLVMAGEVDHAMCISGGLHHALRSQASGFCVYNDAGVAIARLKQDHPGIRIAYVDTDAHHGDGVQWMFYDDPEVLTVSMHESGRYLFPGTGEIRETGRETAPATVSTCRWSPTRTMSPGSPASRP